MMMRLSFCALLILWTAAAVRAEEAPPAAVAPEAEKPSEKPNPWSGQIYASVRVKEGNSDRSEVSTGVDVTRERPKTDKLVLKAIFNYAESLDLVTDRNFYAMGKYDYLVHKDLWYVFGSQSYQFDEFQDLDRRTITSTGMGYNIIKRKQAELSVELGLSYTTERYEMATESDTEYVGGRAAVHLKAKPHGMVVFSEDFVYVPSFEDEHDYTIRNEAFLDLQFTPAWSLRLGHLLDYDDTPAAGNEELEQTYILALKFAIGVKQK